MNSLSAKQRFSTNETSATGCWNPWKSAYIDVPEEFSGAIIQKLSERKGELQGMSLAGDGSTRLEFAIPARGLIGFRGDFLTSTKGNGIYEYPSPYPHLRRIRPL